MYISFYANIAYSRTHNISEGEHPRENENEEGEQRQSAKVAETREERDTRSTEKGARQQRAAGEGEAVRRKARKGEAARMPQTQLLCAVGAHVKSSGAAAV